MSERKFPMYEFCLAVDAAKALWIEGFRSEELREAVLQSFPLRGEWVDEIVDHAMGEIEIERGRSS